MSSSQSQERLDAAIYRNLSCHFPLRQNLTPQFIFWVNEAAEYEVNSVPQEGGSIVKSRWSAFCPAVGLPQCTPEVMVDERVSWGLWEDGPLPAADSLAKWDMRNGGRALRDVVLEPCQCLACTADLERATHSLLTWTASALELSLPMGFVC